MQDTNITQSDDQQRQPVQPVSAGNPEAPVSMPAREHQPQSVEYGYESIKNIENAPSPAETIERKEATAPGQTNQSQAVKPPPKKVTKPPVNKVNMPSFFGYKVPLQIANNPTLVMAKKGKGKDSEARTWIYVLLDRLMKKQSQSKTV